MIVILDVALQIGDCVLKLLQSHSGVSYDHLDIFELLHRRRARILQSIAFDYKDLVVLFVLVFERDLLRNKAELSAEILASSWTKIFFKAKYMHIALLVPDNKVPELLFWRLLFRVTAITDINKT